MNNSSLLSNQSAKNKSGLKRKDTTTLPPINTAQTLKYQNDYDNYEEEFNQFKSNNLQNNSKVSSELSKIGSSRVLSSLSSEIKQQQIKPTQKVFTYEDSPNFWKSKSENVQTNPYIHHDEKEQYRDKSFEQIQQQVKKMRKQLIEMNQLLNQRLDTYNLAKSQFVPKNLVTQSKCQFYLNQIQTNKKMQQAQTNELKKLSAVEQSIKDKDILLDLEHLSEELQKELHSGIKQEHDAKLKLHKQDLQLDQLIKVDQNNKDNNLVNLIKLQIVYHIKKLNTFKIHEEHLEHEENLIKENNKNLEIKMQNIIKTNRYFNLVDQKFEKNKTKHEKLLQKRNTLLKNIEALKRSAQINEQKIARQIISIDQEFRLNVTPNLIKSDEENEDLQHKISRLIENYGLNDSVLKDIKYKFAEDLIHNKVPSQNKLLKTMLKPPNFRSQNSSKLSQFETLQTAISKPRERFQSSRLNIDTKSNQRILTGRYNDKNVTIDVINVEQDYRNKKNQEKHSLTSSNNLKPKNFRIFSRNPNSIVHDKNKSFSSTIQHTSSADNSQNTFRMKVLKPKLLTPRQIKS